MQPRCVNCLAEHYGPAVLAISHGHLACESCHQVTKVYTDLERYRADLRAARLRSFVRRSDSGPLREEQP